MPPVRRSLRLPLVPALRGVMSRTDRGPLRPVWRLAYEVVARAGARWVTRGERGAAAFVRGSLAVGEARYGLSDIDLVIVLPGDDENPGDARRRVTRRWERAVRRLPPLGRLVSVAAYERKELAAAVRAPAPTYGLGPDGAAAPLFYRQPYLEDALWLRTRPGIYGPLADWRRLHGRARLPAPPRRDAQDERVAAWLELQWWWRHAIAACEHPSAPYVRYLLAKLVSEPLRLLLWLEYGERHRSRREALERGLVALPEEEVAIRRALGLLGSAAPEAPPLAELLAAFVRLSARVAAHNARAMADAPVQDVRLVGVRTNGADGMPLADWRALVLGEPADEEFVVLPGSPDDPAAVVRAAGAATPDAALPGLRAGELLVMPLRDLWVAGFLRTLQCPVTDPVSFALLDGAVSARFPTLRGWSATDWAARAAAEHAPRLAEPPDDPARAIALALTAARAGLLAESLRAGEPELALTPPDAAAALADRGAAARIPARDAGAWWTQERPSGTPPPIALARELLAAARGLPAYANAP